MKIKNICCIGAGYVGGPTMSVFALKCPDINFIVVDISEEKINAWNNYDLKKLPVYEPGLKEIIAQTRNKNLFFSTDIDEAIKKSEMIFMSVNTPTKTKGEGKGMAADLRFVESCAKRIGEVSNKNKIVVEKSTLPVRTAEKIKEVLNTHNSDKKIKFEILSNPEFLAEGTAINDLLKPDRVLIGGDNSGSGKEATQLLVELYKKWIPKEKILTTNIWSSELSKLVSNAFLAQRVSSINSISAICEKTGANIEEVSKAVGMDSRIGSKFLTSSIGFGGSCFKKDILNLVYISEYYGLKKVANYWQQVIDINNYQTNRVFDKVCDALNLRSQIKRSICILGWAFKKNTNDSRESASIYLTKQLLEIGVQVNVYDPMVKKNKIFNDIETVFNTHNSDNLETNLKSVNLNVLNSAYAASKNSSAIIICTEWDEFKTLDWTSIYDSMEKPSWVFDGRNIIDDYKLLKLGFKTFKIGKS
tara:strand:- start:673 stop:2094 length:1422 start_codon:yes stop_codon:yes gene_type:complete